MNNNNNKYFNFLFIFNLVYILSNTCSFGSLESVLKSLTSELSSANSSAYFSQKSEKAKKVPAKPIFFKELSKEHFPFSLGTIEVEAKKGLKSGHPEASVDSSEIFYVGVEEVLQQLARELTRTLPLRGELKLATSSVFKKVPVSTKKYTFKFLNLPKKSLASRFNVSFKIVGEGIENKVFTLPINCELWQDIYLVKDQVHRNRALEAEHFRLVNENVLKYPHFPIPGWVDLSLYESNQNLSPNSPLFWTQITRKPDIRKGKVVDMLAQEGSMRITTKGMVLQNGLINDFVTVKNLQSKRDIQAQIIDENTVKVYF